MDDLKAGGANDEVVAAVIGQIAPRASLAMPKAFRPAIKLAVAMLGQWRMVGGGMAPMRPVAFDLPALDVAARWLGITPGPQLLAQMQIIEAEALRQMERRE